MLPLIAESLSLNYAQVGFLKTANNTATSLLELPSGILSERFGERSLLVLGLVCAALGYFGVVLADSYELLAFCFLLAGAGAAFQHSLSSSLLVRGYPAHGRRRALGIYNAAGDGGKLGFTGIFGLVVGAGIAWDLVVGLFAALALLFGLCVRTLLRHLPSNENETTSEASNGTGNWGISRRAGFASLGIAVFFDSVIQSVFLTYIAFILLAHGAGEGAASLAVVLVLSGGMAGKFLCGFAAARFGDRYTFIVLQLLTFLALHYLTDLSPQFLLLILPLIGIVVQGSSTVTYGGVSDFVVAGRQSRAYGLVYTFAATAGVAGPVLFGLLADRIGLFPSVQILAYLALLTLPLGWALSRRQVRLDV